MSHIRYSIVLFLLSLLVGCNALDLSAATSTIVPSNTPQPSEASLPTHTLEPTITFTPEPTFTATIMPTIEPMIAISNTSVTFRSGPNKGSDNLGGAYANQKVQVIARNVTGTWFYIIAPDTPDGRAWVLAAAFTFQGDLTRLPIAYFPKDSKIPTLLPPLIYTVPGGTPLPLNSPAPGAVTAQIVQLGKVRVGPGLGYMEMGLLNAGSIVVLTGRIHGNTWLQIEYPSGLDGRGWISEELIKFEGDYAALPFYNQMATPVIEGEEEESVAVDPPSSAETHVDTAIPPTSTPDKQYGIITTQINVRSGPASRFDSYGLIDPNQRVNILGQTINGLWFKIEYPAAPTGVAWVSSQYVKLMSNIKGLPYFDNEGNPLP